MADEDAQAQCRELARLLSASKLAASGADLLISALAAAAGSYRRSTATTPFPDDLFPAGPGGRDYEALLEALQALPPVDSMMPATHLMQHVSAQQRRLLLWLLSHPRRPVGTVQRCSLSVVQGDLPGLTGWVADIGMNPSLRPSAAFLLCKAPLDVGTGSGRILAFHGTSMENLHSILHNGLMNASGTRLERTGAAFGAGIYFSTQLPVAFAFCQPAEGWQRSGLGRRLRALLVCSLAREHVQGAHNSDVVPDKYLIVERMDAVQIHYLFLYSDDEVAGAANPSWRGPTAAGAQQQQPRAYGTAGGAGGAAVQPQQGTSPLLWLLLGFTLMLMAVGVRDNWPQVRRFLRRTLGVPLY